MSARRRTSSNGAVARGSTRYYTAVDESKTVLGSVRACAVMGEHVRLIDLWGFFRSFHGPNQWIDRKCLAAAELTPSGLDDAAVRLDELEREGASSAIQHALGRDALFLGMLAFNKRVVQLPLYNSRLKHLVWWIGKMGLDELSDDHRQFTISSGGRIQVTASAALHDSACHRLTLTKEVLLGLFPRKSHPNAGRKANMFLDHVLRDLEGLSNDSYLCVVNFIRYIRPGVMTDDQMCSAILYAWALTKHVPFGSAFAYAVACIINPKRGKAVSDVLKATGCTAHTLGCCMAECSVLLGRGVGRTDLVADAKLRVGGTPHPAVANVDQKQLKRAINHILDMELTDERIRLPEPRRFWAERFRWCVAGNHSKAANRHWDKRLQYQPPEGRRFTRRICAELQDEYPLEKWDGTVGVSVGEKIEHAKSRAIYSCDTLSYFAFSWLLSTVEKYWNSRRVILDPGKDGSLGIYGRITRTYSEMGMHCFVMADYADFNSQHSLESQKTLISTLLERLDCPDPELARKLVASFDKMECYHLGWYLGRVNSTLMSGHRATTFINSVLNAAYCLLAWGRDTFCRIPSYHVGDDVIIMTTSCDHGWQLLDELQSVGCTLQPSKQSVGFYVFEFLRMAGTIDKGARGYVARAIAGLVSGNWVTDNAMEPREGLFSLITQFRSVINRSSNPHAYKIGLSSSARITGVDQMVLAELLSGEVAVYPGPCYRNDGKYVFRRLLDTDADSATRKAGSILRKQPLNATYEYLAEGLHPVERYAIDTAGYAPVTSMAIASYGLSCPSRDGGGASNGGRVVLGNRESVWKVGHICTDEVTTTEVLHGVLACYPVAQLLRHELPLSAVTTMLQILGLGGTSSDVMALAWGAEHTGTCVYGVLPYSDAAGIGARFNRGTIMVDTPINM